MQFSSGYLLDSFLSVKTSAEILDSFPRVILEQFDELVIFMLL